MINFWAPNLELARDPNILKTILLELYTSFM